MLGGTGSTQLLLQPWSGCVFLRTIRSEIVGAAQPEPRPCLSERNSVLHRRRRGEVVNQVARNEVWGLSERGRSLRRLAVEFAVQLHPGSLRGQ